MSHDRPLPEAAQAPYPAQPSPRVEAAVPVADAAAAPRNDTAKWIAAGIGSAAIFAAALYATRQVRKK